VRRIVLLVYKTRDEPPCILSAKRHYTVAMRDIVGDLRAASAAEPVTRTTTSYRPDPMENRGRSWTLEANESTGNAAPEVILAKVGFRQIAIRVQEILYVEAARNYVRVYLENGNVLKSRVPIDRLAQHLGTDRFLRIHRGRLVNTSRIRGVTPLVGGRLQLTLNQGSTIAVARDRRRAILAQLDSVLDRGTQSPAPLRSSVR